MELPEALLDNARVSFYGEQISYMYIAVKVLGIFLHMAAFKIIICLFKQKMNNEAVMVSKTTH